MLSVRGRSRCGTADVGSALRQRRRARAIDRQDLPARHPGSPGFFNANHTNNTNDQTNPNDWTHDNRSDDKGPEPENVTVAKLFGREFAFVVLERIGGVVIYEVTRSGTRRGSSTT